MRFEVRIVFAGWRRSRWRSYRRLGRLCGLSWVSVLREGYAAERVYVICRGAIKLTTASVEEKLLLVRVAGRGMCWGWLRC